MQRNAVQPNKCVHELGPAKGECNAVYRAPLSTLMFQPLGIRIVVNAASYRDHQVGEWRQALVQFFGIADFLCKIEHIASILEDHLLADNGALDVSANVVFPHHPMAKDGDAGAHTSSRDTSVRSP